MCEDRDTKAVIPLETSMDKTFSTDVLNRMCRGRGLVLDRINPVEDLLLPPSGSAADLDNYLSLLDHYAVRLLLKEVIKSENMEAWMKGRRSVERFCHTEAVDSFLDRLKELRVVKEHPDGRPVPSVPVTGFGPTYEWYVAKVLETGFLSPAAWGVRFSDMESGGDHDVVSSVSGRFLYLEAKTAPPKHIEQPEASGFVRRLFDVAPDIAIFHNDTHLRMKDKIVPMLEEAITSLRQASGKKAVFTLNSVKSRFTRLEREIFHLGSSLYVINSKPDLTRNLKIVFRHYFRNNNKILDLIF